MKTKAFLIISILFAQVLIFGAKAYCQTAVDAGDMIVDNQAPYVVESTVSYNTTVVSKLKWVKDGPIREPESNGYGVIRTPQGSDGSYYGVAPSTVKIRVVFSEPLDAIRKPTLILKFGDRQQYTKDEISMDAEDTTNITYYAVLPYKLSLNEYTITIGNAFDLAGNPLDSNPATIAERNISDPKTWIRNDKNANSWLYTPDNNHVFYVSYDRIAIPTGFTTGTANRPVAESYLVGKLDGAWKILDGGGLFGVIYGYGETKYATEHVNDLHTVIFRRDKSYDSTDETLSISPYSFSQGYVYFPGRTNLGVPFERKLVFIPDANVTGLSAPANDADARTRTWSAPYIFVYDYFSDNVDGKSIYQSFRDFYILSEGSDSYKCGIWKVPANIPLGRAKPFIGGQIDGTIELSVFNMAAYMKGKSYGTSNIDAAIQNKFFPVNPMLALQQYSANQKDKDGKPSIYKICIAPLNTTDPNDLVCQEPGGTITVNSEGIKDIIVQADDYMSSNYVYSPHTSDYPKHGDLQYMAPGVYKLNYIIKSTGANAKAVKSGGLILDQNLSTSGASIYNPIKTLRYYVNGNSCTDCLQVPSYAVSKSIPKYGGNGTMSDSEYTSVGNDTTSYSPVWREYFDPVKAPDGKYELEVNVWDAAENSATAKINLNIQFRSAPKPPGWKAPNGAQRITQNMSFLQWDMPTKNEDETALSSPEIAGYNVYRKISGEPDSSYVKLNTGSAMNLNRWATDSVLVSEYDYDYALSAIRKLKIADETYYVEGKKSSEYDNTIDTQFGARTAGRIANENINNIPSMPPSSLKSYGWNLISQPQDLRPAAAQPDVYFRISDLYDVGGDTDIVARYQSDLGTETTPGHMLVPQFSYCKSSGCPLSEVPYKSCTINEHKPGTAYWLYTENPAGVEKFNALEIPNSAAFKIYLHQGWNMVSNPFTNIDLPITDANIRFINPKTSQGLITYSLSFTDGGDNVIKEGFYGYSKTETPVQYSAGMQLPDEFAVKGKVAGLSYRYYVSNDMRTDWTAMPVGWTHLYSEYTFDASNGSITTRKIQIRNDTSEPVMLSEAITKGWIDGEIKSFEDSYTKVTSGGNLERWKGYMIYANASFLQMIISNPVDQTATDEKPANITEVSFKGQCNLTPPATKKKAPERIARMGAAEATTTAKIAQRGVGQLVDVALYVSNVPDMGVSSFKVSWDPGKLELCERQSATSTMCRKILAGEDVPLSSSIIDFSSKMTGNSVDVTMATLNEEPVSGRVSLGTMSFRVVGIATGTATTIGFDTSDPKLSVTGEVAGDTVSYGVISDPLIVANGLTDTTAPVVSVTSPCNGCTVTDTLPRVVASIADGQSWIASGTVTATIDGKAVAFEAGNDGYSGSLIFSPTEPLATGSHLIKVVAYDAYKNMGSIEWPFNVGAPSTVATTPKYKFEYGQLIIELPESMNINDGDTRTPQQTLDLVMLTDLVFRDIKSKRVGSESGDAQDFSLSYSKNGRIIEIKSPVVHVGDTLGAVQPGVQPIIAGSDACSYELDIWDTEFHASDCAKSPNSCFTPAEAQNIAQTYTTGCPLLESITGSPITPLASNTKAVIPVVYSQNLDRLALYKGNILYLTFKDITPANTQILYHEIVHAYNAGISDYAFNEGLAEEVSRIAAAQSTTANYSLRYYSSFLKPSASQYFNLGEQNMTYRTMLFLEKLRVLAAKNPTTDIIKTIYDGYRANTATRLTPYLFWRDLCTNNFPGGIEGMGCERWTAAQQIINMLPPSYSPNPYKGKDRNVIVADIITVSSSSNELTIQYSNGTLFGGPSSNTLLDINLTNWNNQVINSANVLYIDPSTNIFSSHFNNSYFDIGNISGTGRMKAVVSRKDDPSVHDVSYYYHDRQLYMQNRGGVFGIVTNRNSGTLKLSWNNNGNTATTQLINGGFIFDGSAMQNIIDSSGSFTLTYTPIGLTTPTITQEFTKSSTGDHSAFNNSYFVQMTDLNIINIAQKQLTVARNGQFVALNWGTLTEQELLTIPDFAGFRVFRSNSPISDTNWGDVLDFTPLGTKETSYIDTLDQAQVGNTVYYRVTAIDALGNELPITASVASSASGTFITNVETLKAGIHAVTFNSTPPDVDNIKTMRDFMNSMVPVGEHGYTVYQADGVPLVPASATIHLGTGYFVKIDYTELPVVSRSSWLSTLDTSTHTVSVSLHQGYNLVTPPFKNQIGGGSASLPWDTRQIVAFQDGTQEDLIFAAKDRYLAAYPISAISFSQYDMMYGLSFGTKGLTGLSNLLNGNNSYILYASCITGNCPVSLNLWGTSVSGTQTNVPQQTNILTVDVDNDRLNNTLRIDAVNSSNANIPSSTDSYDMFDVPAKIPESILDEFILISTEHSATEPSFNVLTPPVLISEAVADFQANANYSHNFILLVNGKTRNPKSREVQFNLNAAQYGAFTYRLKDLGRTDAAGAFLTTTLFDNAADSFCDASNICTIDIPTDGTAFTRRYVLTIGRGNPAPSADHVYAGKIGLDGHSDASFDGTVVTLRNIAGATIGQGVTDADGNFAVYTTAVADSMLLNKDTYVLEDVSLTNAVAPVGNYIVPVNLSLAGLQTCTGSDGRTFACLRGGNAKYETRTGVDGDDESRTVSIRQIKNLPRYEAAGRNIATATVHVYDADNFYWHILERSKTSHENWTADSQKADINNDRRVDTTDYKLLWQAYSLGCTETSCGEQCVTTSDATRCGIRDTSCNSPLYSVCAKKPDPSNPIVKIPISWRDLDLVGAGSINKDNRITVDDAMEVYNCINYLAVTKPLCRVRMAADIDGNGEVGMSDWAFVKRLLGCTASTCDDVCLLNPDYLENNPGARCGVNDTSCNSNCEVTRNTPGNPIITWKDAAAIDGDARSAGSNDVALFTSELNNADWTAESDKADINEDGAVDMKDFDLIKMAFNSPADNTQFRDASGAPILSYRTGRQLVYADADIDGTGTGGVGDGVINMKDFTVLKKNYMRGYGLSNRPGFDRVDWDLDGRITFSDYILSTKGKSRCNFIHDHIKAEECTVCNDKTTDSINDCR